MHLPTALAGGTRMADLADSRLYSGHATEKMIYLIFTIVNYLINVLFIDYFNEPLICLFSLDQLLGRMSL